MKKFTKLFLSCMAVSAITAAIATSAMAAEGDLTVDYNQETGVVKASVEGAKADAQSTVLVLAPKADGKPADKTAVTDKDILYIDQKAGASFEGGLMALDGAIRTEENAKGTYVVMVGYEGSDGTFKVASSSFTLGAEAVLVGDADGDMDITNNDATQILRKGASLDSTITDDNFNQVAYSDGDYDITNNDATQILRKGAGLSCANVGVEMVVPDKPAE